MARLEQQVRAGGAHTERMRLQMDTLGRIADLRHDEVAARIFKLGEMMERVLGRAAGPPPTPLPRAQVAVGDFLRARTTIDPQLTSGASPPLTHLGEQLL